MTEFGSRRTHLKIHRSTRQTAGRSNRNSVRTFNCYTIKANGQFFTDKVLVCLLAAEDKLFRIFIPLYRVLSGEFKKFRVLSLHEGSNSKSSELNSNTMARSVKLLRNSRTCEFIFAGIKRTPKNEGPLWCTFIEGASFTTRPWKEEVRPEAGRARAVRCEAVGGPVQSS